MAAGLARDRCRQSIRTTRDWVGGGNNMRRLVALALALSLVGSVALSAQKPKKPKGKSQETQVTVVFIDTQREAARSYFVKQHGRGNCPPGLGQEAQRVPASGTGEEALRPWPDAAARHCCRETPRRSYLSGWRRPRSRRLSIRDSRRGSGQARSGPCLWSTQSRAWFGSVVHSQHSPTAG